VAAAAATVAAIDALSKTAQAHAPCFPLASTFSHAKVLLSMYLAAASADAAAAAVAAAAAIVKLFSSYVELKKAVA